MPVDRQVHGWRGTSSEEVSSRPASLSQPQALYPRCCQFPSAVYEMWRAYHMPASTHPSTPLSALSVPAGGPDQDWDGGFGDDPERRWVAGLDEERINAALSRMQVGALFSCSAALHGWRRAAGGR